MTIGRVTGWRRVARSGLFRLTVAAVALAIATLAALLAQDVRSWHRTLRTDATTHMVTPSAEPALTASTFLPSSVSGRLLDVGQDQRWFEALQSYTLARRIRIDSDIGVTRQQEEYFQSTEAALARLTHDGDPARASRAYQLLGIVLFLDARGSVSPALATYAASISAMQNAIRVEPSNIQAKVDLELLLSQQEADSTKRKQKQAGNPNARTGHRAQRGEGSPPPNGPIGDY